MLLLQHSPGLLATAPHSGQKYEPLAAIALPQQKSGRREDLPHSGQT